MCFLVVPGRIDYLQKNLDRFSYPHVGPSCTPPRSKLCPTLVRVVPHPGPSYVPRWSELYPTQTGVHYQHCHFQTNADCTTNNVIAKCFGDHQLTELSVSRTGNLLLEHFLQYHQLLLRPITHHSLLWNGERAGLCPPDQPPAGGL